MKLSIDLEKENPEVLTSIVEIIQQKIRDTEKASIDNEHWSKEDRIVMAIIDYLKTKIGNTIPTEDIFEESKKLGLDERKVSTTVDTLKKMGKIIEPREGFLQKI